MRGATQATKYWRQVFDRFLSRYYLALERNSTRGVDEADLRLVPPLPASTQRVGYIVATCSPVTRAHIELGATALKLLALDVVYYILWPFVYIPGFHAFDVRAWALGKGLLDWDVRVHLLKNAISESGLQGKLRVLEQAKILYERSAKNFDPRKHYKILYHGPLSHGATSASAIRQRDYSREQLSKVTYESVVRFILDKRLWGY